MKLASQSPKTALAAKATKFGGVFTEEWDSQQSGLKKDQPKKHWSGWNEDGP